MGTFRRWAFKKSCLWLFKDNATPQKNAFCYLVRKKIVFGPVNEFFLIVGIYSAANYRPKALELIA